MNIIVDIELVLGLVLLFIGIIVLILNTFIYDGAVSDMIFARKEFKLWYKLSREDFSRNFAYVKTSHVKKFIYYLWYDEKNHKHYSLINMDGIISIFDTNGDICYSVGENRSKISRIIAFRLYNRFQSDIESII